MKVKQKLLKKYFMIFIIQKYQFYSIMMKIVYLMSLLLAYLSARDTYRVEREEKSGKGYADFTFHPRRKNDLPFIVELKKDENTRSSHRTNQRKRICRKV